jgi:hypothetical protein
MARSFKIQGYNYTGYGTDVYGTDISKQQLAEIKETGANAIAIIPEYYQKTLQSNTLAPTNITPDDDDLIAGIKAAQAKGLNVLLNPHMDTEDGQWRAYLDPTDPQKWFESYKAMEVHYAKIAAQTGVKSYSVGCELESMTGANYRSEWLDIIDAVRQVYHGELTYAATTTEAATLSFWDKLDVIGVDGYFSLAVKDDNPTVKELEYAWTHPSASNSINKGLDGKSPVDYMHDLAEKYGKHVQFTECGFRAINGDAKDPGDWSMNGALDEQEQADLYKAMFNTFASQGGDWFDGFYAWDWRADDYTEPKDYHTRGRAAQKIIDQWYGMDDHDRRAPDTGMDLLGTVRNDTLTAGVGGTRVLGGDGNDRLIGGDGNDILIGGGQHPGSKSVVSIAAHADMLDGVGAQFKVLINGKVVGTGEATGGHTEAWDNDPFAFSLDTPKAFHSIKVVFTNDDADNQGHDRNLYVDSIVINGETIDLKDAENSQNPHTGTLWANGGFSIDLGSQSKQLTPSRSDSDVLDGGYGNDVLTGGAGHDTFGFATGYGKDEVTDFGKGDDFYVVNWKAIADFGALKDHAQQHGNNLWIVAGTDTLIIDHFHKSDLRAGDFEF